MSNWAYFASRTPSAMFSKSQNTARLRASWLGGTWMGLGRVAPREPGLQPLEIEVDHRCDVEGEHLRQQQAPDHGEAEGHARAAAGAEADGDRQAAHQRRHGCLLYTSDAADERSSVDLGGRRIIKKK